MCSLWGVFLGGIVVSRVVILILIALTLLTATFQACGTRTNFTQYNDQTNSFELNENIQANSLGSDSKGFIPQSTGDSEGSQRTMVIMAYEAWFGPRAAQFSNRIRPQLNSPGMRNGIGYDSRDERIIEQHFRWLMEMGIDAILLDHSNAIACTFAPKAFEDEVIPRILREYEGLNKNLPERYLSYINTFLSPEWRERLISSNPDSSAMLQLLYDAFGCIKSHSVTTPTLVEYMDNIRRNNENIFTLFDKFRVKYGKTIKIVPLLGGYEPTAWEKIEGLGNKAPIDLQLSFYDSLFRKYPELRLQHENKTLVLNYFAAPLRIVHYADLEQRLGSEIWSNYTVRKMGGFVSNQKGTPGYLGRGNFDLPMFSKLWSWHERLKSNHTLPKQDPSYSVGTNQQIEAFTVTMSAPSVIDGWGDPKTGTPTTTGDLRKNGETFKEFMKLAGRLQPQFLLINQFNCFTPPDSGWDEETTNDIEPTERWGTKYVDLVKEEIKKYRQLEASKIIQSSFRGFVGGTREPLIGGVVIKGSKPRKIIIRALGPSLGGGRKALSNPKLTLRSASGQLIKINDNWQSDPQANFLRLRGYAPQYPNEAAFVATLEPHTPYTAIVEPSGSGGNSGLALVELIDVDSENFESRISHISGRVKVETNEGVLIGGVIARGKQKKRLVISVLGPSLPGITNTLRNPKVRIISPQGQTLENDDWQNGPSADEIRNIGLQPGDPQESALILEAEPDKPYSIIVEGVGNSRGQALLNIIEL